MALRWVLAATLLSCALCYPRKEQKFAMEPQNQTAIIGSKVTLPCRVINKSGVLQWTKDDFGLGTHRNLSGFDRYRMIGSDEEGDYSLEIDSVMLDDDARYQCQVSVGMDGQPGIRSQFASVTVLVPPEPPVIVQGATMLTTEDREVELECVSRAGKPPAEITWIDGAGNVLTDNIEYIVEPLDDGRRFTSRSVLKLMPRKRHHNTTFVCQAQNAADRNYKAAKMLLEVKYAPKVSVELLSRKTGRIIEGEDVRFRCIADANPMEGLTYEWFMNKELLVSETGTELTLRNVTRDQHEAMVKCRARNAVGNAEAYETLEVSYGPVFRHKIASVQVELGKTATLSCDVDGNPPPDIEWTHENTRRVMGSQANLTLTVDKSLGGRYACRASVTGFMPVVEAASIYIKGRPYINSNSQQFGDVGDLAVIECTAHAIPRPERVTWSLNGQEIDFSNPEYSVEESPLPDGVRSKLLVRDSQMEHYGIYNCSVTNQYGTHWREINFKPKKNFPHLLILTGVIFGVIIIVSVSLIVILCQRKRIKKPPIPMDCNGEKNVCNSKESDRSSNISDLKLELRTGSSVSNVHCDLDYGPESETGSESVVTRIGVPLAGPVALGTLGSISQTSTLPHCGIIPQANGGDRIFRYSSDFPEPVFPPKSSPLQEGQSNNGYVPYVDYSRDYNPPSLETSRESVAVANSASRLSSLSGVDPRFSAAYGNPYLRNSNSSLPVPHAAPGPHTPAPPPYTARQNGAAPQVARLPSSPTSQYIVPAREAVTIKRGTLATHV